MGYRSEYEFEKEYYRAILFGLGLDYDGHKRITRGDNFLLVGGSEETHGKMTDTTLAFNQELDKRVKTLEELTPEEFHEIMRKIGNLR